MLQEVINLGLPQWLPLNDAEDLIAKHLAAGVDAMDDELLKGEVCSVPTPAGPVTENGPAASPELELDLDCWRVCCLASRSPFLM